MTMPLIADDDDTNGFSIFANILCAKPAVAWPIRFAIWWIE